MPLPELDAAFALLAQRGLNVHAVLATEEAAEVVPSLSELAEAWPSTVLIGSTGGAMWASMERRGYLDRLNPVDEHAADALAVFSGALPVRTRPIWPAGDTQISVMGLGGLAGWNRSSPLGLGLHPEHGLWVAYRGVLLLDLALPLTPVTSSPHACLTCASRACVSACPSSAVGDGIDPLRCLGAREQGDCATRCHARLACPVGTQSAYPLVQIAHHHRGSTAMLRRCAGAGR